MFLIVQRKPLGGRLQLPQKVIYVMFIDFRFCTSGFELHEEKLFINQNVIYLYKIYF